MLDHFESPKSLVSHAREEITNLDARLAEFFGKHPYARIIDIDRDTGEKVHKFRLTAKLPGKVSNIVKDIAGNLRDALDHAVYGCAVSLYGGEPSDTGFPFAKDAAGVDGELKGKRLRGNPPEIRSFLAAFNPYPGGNDLLWGLNQIRNPNTHRIIVPVGTAVVSNSSEMRNLQGGTSLKFGYSHWDPAKNEVEFLRASPDWTFQYKVQIAFDVTFEGTLLLSGKPLVPTLIAIADEVERVCGFIEAETARILGERVINP